MHRSEVLKDLEVLLNSVRSKIRSEVTDVNVWRRKSGFKANFSTNKTWMTIRETNVQYSWTRGTWFSMATPKFAFVAWLAMLDRLSTMDRVSKWSHGVDTTCVMCKIEAETRDHLFFKCSYTSQLWEHLTSGILRSSYSNDWSSTVLLITNEVLDKKSLFCVLCSVYGKRFNLLSMQYGEKEIGSDMEKS